MRECVRLDCTTQRRRRCATPMQITQAISRSELHLPLTLREGRFFVGFDGGTDFTVGSVEGDGFTVDVTEGVA